jgi:hypothetical protein
LILSTTKWPAKYLPSVNIESVERSVWSNGIPVNWKDWKIMEFPNDIGASNWSMSRWMRVENSAWYIHGHPISREEFLRLLKK